MTDLKVSIARYGTNLAKEFDANPMVVFLCGPSASKVPEPGAALRVELHKALVDAGFEVVLGEDDGLLDLQKLYGKYAHTNELHFVQDQAAAVVLVAASIGSFCELGMFADRLATGDRSTSQDFIVIADAQYQGDPSYFNHGPALAAGDFGVTFYADFSTFDTSRVVERLKRRRAVWKSETRGRPRAE